MNVYPLGGHWPRVCGTRLAGGPLVRIGRLFVFLMSALAVTGDPLQPSGPSDASVSPVARAVPADPERPAIVFVHGFNRERALAPFRREFIRVVEAAGQTGRVSIACFEWESGKITARLDMIIPLWETAKTSAVAAAATFSREVIAVLEDRSQPYYLVGHSLGCRLILLAIEAHGAPLQACRGVYFLGAAADANARLPEGLLPQGLRIVNYFSADFDVALGVSYRTADGHAAGGSVGFADAGTFVNYRTRCTHVHKSDLLYADWVRMVKPIVHLILWQEGIALPGRTKRNWRVGTADGDLGWNDLARFHEAEGDADRPRVLIQQYNGTGHYRALRMRDDGTARIRVARGADLHAILRAVGVWDQRTQWPEPRAVPPGGTGALDAGAPSPKP